WGKEYTSIANDGYDIADYTPFSAPVAGSGLRHLFASTTLDADNDGEGSDDHPLLRVALSNTHRIWEWVAKEGPVADDSIETSAGGHPGHPDDHSDFEALVNMFANPSSSFGSASWLDYSIRNHVDQRYPSPSIADFGAIDGAGNPWGDDYDPYNYDDDEQDNYLTIFTGILKISTAGDYDFAVDGDDAVEVIIDGGTANELIVGYYGPHGADGSTNYNGSMTLSAGTHTVEFRMEEAGGGDKYYLYWSGPASGNAWQIVPNTAFTSLTIATYRLSTPASTITDYVVRVKVCDTSVGLEPNCKQYPDGDYKPIGILQRHGESDRMYFGLMTGSYEKNTSGGVLRKKVGSIKDEILTTTTGQYNSTVNGIIKTIDEMHILDWDYDSLSYQNCGWITDGPMEGGECRDWGNPVAEMMYETQRYFAGLGSATSDFTFTESGSADARLGLKQASWNDPYDETDGGFPTCSKPFMLVLSDINPTFDSDELPGINSNFGTGMTADLPGSGFDAEDLADEISTAEGISGNKYIGQSGSIFDGSCTEKTITGFGNIRGLCPEEPTKGGSYYAASVAKYGHLTDLQPSIAGDQKVLTYSVGLASPLPRINLTVGEHDITLVPFAKTVGSNGNSHVWNYWPTNTIVDFFVDTLTPTSGTFRINYEDVEQGADHDMDDIVVYTYQLIDSTGTAVSDPATATAVDISLSTTYASGSYIQHAGYIISGTTADGTYLEVTDDDTDPGDDFLVFLDTPPGSSPISSATDVIPSRDQPGNSHNVALGVLPKSTTRRFTPNSSGAEAAQLLENPLWYAAKWGAFDDADNDGTPIEFDEDGNPDNSEWDKDGDGIPDTYYYVTNPLKLEQQLNKSFASILNQASSGTAASVISNTRSGEGAIYQSVFFPSKTDEDGHSVSWVGQIHALLMDAYGNMREDTIASGDTVANGTLDLVDDYIVVFNEDGTAGRYEDGDGNQKLELDTASCPSRTTPPATVECYDSFVDTVSLDDLNYLWRSSDWLNSSTIDTNIETQRSDTGAAYLTDDDKRYIFTWIDGDRDAAVDSSEIKPFVWPSSAPSAGDLDDIEEIYPYLTLYPTFLDTPSSISSLSTVDFDTFLVEQTERQINYIRGEDYLDDNGNPVPLSDSSDGDIAGTEVRSRLYDGKTWRLGDITYSTPTLVGRPAENFHLLYQDLSYAYFAEKYKNRRQVVYAGANDGMVHAFNGGFFDANSKRFCTDYPCGSDSSMPALGSELWAYVPYNLLTHLYWLTQTSYDETKHVYYVDQKPRVFDAKIFTEEAACSDLSDEDCIHPNGWGTVMVIGMRFGGGAVVADIDKRDGRTIPDTNDPTMKSAFMVFDITNPERPPELLAELVMPRMGFSTSYPAVVVMKDGDHDGTFESYNDGSPSSGENRWYLAFGSGPADVNGQPGSVNAGTGVYDDSVLDSAKSNQPGQFYMLDLVKLATNNELYTLDSSGDLVAGLNVYTTFDTNTFVSDPVAVDFDLDYNTDAVYFGTISGTSKPWSGKLRRIVIDDQPSPSVWQSNVLMDVGKPITAAPAIGQDDDGRNWVFFGTGRYFNADDKGDDNQQSFYGLKEPLTSGVKDWSTLLTGDIIDATDFNVYSDLSVNGVTDGNWAGLLSDQAVKDGWMLDFSSNTGERTLGQAALIGGLLSFTTFIPESDVCSAGGDSFLWALYYKTGTAHYSGVLGTSTVDDGGTERQQATTNVSLGKGLATSPNIHVGREAGTSVFVQSSTGEITRLQEENPISTKSGMASWKLVQ
ncbi:MAG: hypothetical protein DRP47_10055, partial [Candidatus Zixiibacteriota bacterium]